METYGNKRVLRKRVHRAAACHYWRAGRCNRYPCPFLHSELPAPQLNPAAPGGGAAAPKRSRVWRNPSTTGAASNPITAGGASNPSTAGAASNPSTAGAASNPSTAGAASNPSPAEGASNPSQAGAASNPITAGAASNPSTAGAASNPITAGAASNPSTAGAASNPSPAGAASNPSTAGAASNPSPAEGASNPSTAGAASNPITAGAASNPSTAGAASNPSPAGAASNPSPAGAASNPITAGAASNPITAGAASNPITAGAASNPITAGAASNPSPAEGASNPSTAGAASNPSTAGAASGPPSKWWKGREGGADKVCNYFLAGDCTYGDKCRFLHSWFISDSFSLLTRLQGHQKAVSGITLPPGSDKLYSGSNDETIRAWDCHTGQCVGVINMGGEVGCMISEGPWIFIGVPNSVKAWNSQTATDLSLDGPTGQVYSLVAGNELLFAGTQDGRIVAWKFSAVGNCFEPAASLVGHQRPVVSLVVGSSRLYSGSMDNTIRVWDLASLQCIQTLTDHTSVVMSLLRWDQFLLSCSLDNTIKVWVTTENGNLEVTYTHNEDHGVLSLCGVHDAEGKPVLLCSCNDNSVRLYDLPSFNERGKIFSKEEVRAIQIGPCGLFFTGDATGELKVWKWLISETP